MNERLTKHDLYPIYDRAPLVRLVGESVPYMTRIGVHSSKYKARWTGEKRCPKKGEWFLSGALIECYHAPNNLITSYPIAEIVEVGKVTEYHIKRIF